MREVHYEDDAGNRVITDHDGRLAVINREGRIVNPKGTNRLLKKAGFKFKKSGSSYKIGGGATVTPSEIIFPERHHSQKHHHGIIDLGESRGFYYGTKEKKRTGFGEIDFDFGLKI